MKTFIHQLFFAPWSLYCSDHLAALIFVNMAALRVDRKKTNACWSISALQMNLGGCKQKSFVSIFCHIIQVNYLSVLFMLSLSTSAADLPATINKAVPNPHHERNASRLYVCQCIV